MEVEWPRLKGRHMQDRPSGSTVGHARGLANAYRSVFKVAKQETAFFQAHAIKYFCPQLSDRLSRS